MAIATRTASCRSSPGSRLRSLTSPRILSRASMNSLSSLACSAHLIASLVAEHIPHLLKTARDKLPSWRTKSKHYFSPYLRLCRPLQNRRIRLLGESETTQILALPTRVFNHGAQRTDGKCLTQGIKRNDDPTPVGVPANAMTTSNSLKCEPVCFQCPDETARLQTTRRSRHTLTTTAGSGSSMVP
jgi:hypothetical protein